MYAKPYTTRVDRLKMHAGYQPLKFQQFDGKGNPKQHIAHFVETCNNADTDGDLMVKQFLCLLKGNAFDWYTDIKPGSIDSWMQLKQDFLNHFYSTRRTVSMAKLSNTRQWKDEPVIDYIDYWRNLSLNCRDRLFKVFTIEMCIHGMHSGPHYILQGIQPKTFDKLMTKAHNLEINLGGQEPPVPDPRKQKENQEVKKGGKFPTKSKKKEARVVSVAPVKIVAKATKKENEKVNARQEQRGRKAALREM